MSPLQGISFTERGPIDIAELNALYHIIGWDNRHRRTAAETTEMLKVSRYYIASHTRESRLVGLARVCGAPYTVQILDVITHPDDRRRGIATDCMRGIEKHLQLSNYLSVTLTDERGIAGFYRRFGFHPIDSVIPTLSWKRG